MIRITPIQTGRARMKTAQARGRDGRSALARKLDIFRDDTWIVDLPILAWLVEHPEGRFLVDSGDTAANSTPGYLPWWNPFFTCEVSIRVAPLEEIGPRLQALGLDPARDIAAVILTHLHHDHTGGLDHLPQNRILVPRDCWTFYAGLRGRFLGCLPQRWPIWLSPELIDMDGPPLGPFPSSHAITRDGRIALVPTPGHAHGHVSVVVRGDGVTWFLAGDATYAEADLRAETVDGVTYDPATSLATLRTIKRFASAGDVVVLPSHDPEAVGRLERRQLFR